MNEDSQNSTQEQSGKIVFDENGTVPSKPATENVTAEVNSSAKENIVPEESMSENMVKDQQNIEESQRRDVAYAKRVARGRFVLVYGGVVLFGLIFGGGLFWLHREIRAFQNERFLRDVVVVQEALTQYAMQNPNSTDKPYGDALKNPQTIDGPAPKIQATTMNSLDADWRIQREEKKDGTVVTEMVINNPDRTVEEMEELDKQIDDGDVTTGKFIMKSPGVYSLKIMQSRENFSTNNGQTMRVESSSTEIINEDSDVVSSRHTIRSSRSRNGANPDSTLKKDSVPNTENSQVKPLESENKTSEKPAADKEKAQESPQNAEKKPANAQDLNENYILKK